MTEKYLLKWAAAVVLACSVLLTGCHTTSTISPTTGTSGATTAPLPPPASNVPFVNAVNIVSGVLQAGGNLAFLTLTPAERVTYAKYISGSGHLFQSLETGALPTDSDVTSALAAYFPTTAGNYTQVVNLAIAAVTSFKGIIANYVPSNDANYAAYVNYGLNALANAAFSVAAPYLTPAS